MIAKYIKFYLLSALFILVAAGTAAANDTAAQTGETNRDWEFHTIVDTTFVQAHRTVPMAEDVMIIDARPHKPKYVNGHIPGSVNIPDSQFDKSTALLPDNKGALLIYYCGGLKCRLSHKSAKKAETLGYTNVKVYAKGYPEWLKTKGEYASVSVDYVARAIEENRALIVDSRPRKPKFNKGHIPSAVSMPFTKFETLSGKLPRDLDTPVVFYCGGLKCRLSHKSAKATQALGYTNVKVFSKGYPEWKKAFGASGQEIQIKAGEVEGSMDIAMFKDLLENRPESIMIIDVRDADEFEKGSFKSAVSIPVDNLEDKIKELPFDKPIVFVCSTGARSGESFYMLQDLKPEMKNVYYIEAGIQFNSDGSWELLKSES